MTRAVAFVLALASSACAYGVAPDVPPPAPPPAPAEDEPRGVTPTSIAIDPGADPTLAETTIAAVALWCRDTGGAYCPEVFVGYADRMRADQWQVIDMDLAPYRASGGAWRGLRILALDPRYLQCVGIMAHELGHAAGIDHADDGVMRSAAPCYADAIDAHALAEYFKHNP